MKIERGGNLSLHMKFCKIIKKSGGMEETKMTVSEAFNKAKILEKQYKRQYVSGRILFLAKSIKY